jgi:NAD(P)-dependent dehydrogenase (short-subunit alcohol dehydrogenase family)
VSLEANVEKLVGATFERFGRLDCAFNNAASFTRRTQWPSSTRLYSTA